MNRCGMPYLCMLLLDELMISVPHFDIDATMLEEQEDQDDAKEGRKKDAGKRPFS